MFDRIRAQWRWFVAAAIAAGALYAVWSALSPNGLPPGFASGNGRIEAVEIDIAPKIAGRVKTIAVREGELVQTGQVLATMDVATLEAQLREARAALAQAEIAIHTAQNLVHQREAEKRSAAALVAQRRSEVNVAGKRLKRTAALTKSGAISAQTVDDNRAAYQSAVAAVSASEAGVAAASAALGYAQSNVISARSGVEAAKATIERIQADIDDSTLRAPRDGRVQYRVAEPGEILAAGGIVLNMIDLTDVYMTFFLPTASAGRVAMGAETRVVLDAAPQYVIPAKVSFVADVAQFTPKTVETSEERQKLMFRIKARIAAPLLRKYIRQVKTGLPGMAYVQLDPKAAWPADLAVKLPR